MLVVLWFAFARLHRFGYDSLHRMWRRLSNRDRNRVQVLVITALAIAIFMPVREQKFRDIGPPETGDYFNDLLLDTLAHQRLDTLKVKMDLLLVVASDGTRRDVGQFSPEQKARLVAIIALAKDCSYRKMDDDSENIEDWRYEGVTLTSNSWYDVWNSNVEALLCSDSIAFDSILIAARKDKTLLPRTIEEFDLIEYFSPKKIAKNKSKPKKRTVAKRKTSKAPDVKPGRKTGGGKKYRSREEYIRAFAPVAVAESKRSGVPASVILAQAIWEGRAGMSKLATECNNHFGIKCFERHGGTKRWPKVKAGHCQRHTDDSPKDKFRIYESAAACYRAHSQFLSQPRYAPLFKSTVTPWKLLKSRGSNWDDEEEWGRACKNIKNRSKYFVYGLDALGYATDRAYAEKLLGVIASYDLEKYNR